MNQITISDNSYSQDLSLLAHKNSGLSGLEITVQQRNTCLCLYQCFFKCL